MGRNLFIGISLTLFSQSQNVNSAAIIFKQFKKDNTEKLEAAKEYIDKAYKTKSTSNDPKMWNYRAQIYLKIAQKASEIDQDAILKATEAYLRCMEKGKKGKIIVKKWTPKEEVLEGLVNCGYLLFKFFFHN